MMTLLLVVGATYAGPAPEDHIMAGPLCIDQPTWCNDYIIYYAAGGGGYYHVVGWEYGCGIPDVEVDGSYQDLGGIMWLSLEVHYPTYPGNPYLGTFDAQINWSSGVGPAQWAYHYDGYHWGTNDAVLVPCPKDLDAITPDGPNAAFSR
jgi:hypothetical protein